MYRLRWLSIAAAAAVAFALTLPAGAQFGFDPGPQFNGRGFGKNKVRYRSFDWKIYHSPHFDVHYYEAEEDQLEKVVSFAESAYDDLSRQFNFKIQEPTPLIFYGTHGAFEQNNIILNFIPEGTGAFATLARYRMVLPIDLPDPELMNLIRHELTHIFQYHILYQGSLTKAFTARPPTWFMEGMASFMAKDESARDRMYLRDAVVNDRIPPMTQWQGGGFFAYRMGHALFDFVVEKWGWEGYIDLIFEFRNTLGGSIGRAVERTFRMDPEEFDDAFRLWLRKKYLPQLLETGEPGEFGRPFRSNPRKPTQEISPAASPSGDLLAAFTSGRGEVDVTLIDTENRVPIRNLTKGFSSEFQYLVSQELTLGRKMGRDLSFSPDGNYIAAFAKRESGRSLFLIDVLKGGVRQRIDMPGIEQQLAPAWSPDGNQIAFSGWSGGNFDIFTVDLEGGEIANLTKDEIFDGAPVYSPDGESLVIVSTTGEEGHHKLFRIPLDNPSQRYQLTYGDSDENDPVYSTKWNRVYFTSDRGGVENIFSVDLENGDLRQYTNAVTGCFMPTVLVEPDGEERLVYSAFWKGRFQLYVTEVEEPVTELVTQNLEPEPAAPGDLPVFEPDIQVSISDENRDSYGGFKLYLEDAQSFFGIDDDQTFIGRVVISFADQLGDRRLIASFSSIDSFSNFDVAYFNLSKRIQWSLRLFDDRTFSRVQDRITGEISRDQNLLRETGAVASLIYPLSFYTRGEIGAGYEFRKIDIQSFIRDPDTGAPIPVFIPLNDDFPVALGALVGDSTVFAPWGPISGRRWRLDTFWAPSIGGGGGGTVMTSVDLDVRQYVPLTRRSNLAFRLFAGSRGGDAPTPFIFGGLDTIRGTPIQSIVGTRAFFANIELRFPLVDILATPVINFQGIRGVLFFDIGGAWFHDFQDFDFFDDDNNLDDAIASIGYGITARLFGLQLNWDISKQTDFDDTSDFRTDLWIGTRF